MKADIKILIFFSILFMITIFSYCATSRPVLKHTDYGGCKIKGRHYHNTHVFIGNKHIPSLCEWLKY